MTDKIFIFSVLFMMMSCDNNHIETIKISEIDQSKRYAVNFNLEQGKHVDKIEIRISGWINDTAKIDQYFIFPGKVDTVFKGEWYTSSYFIDYNPYKLTKGYLTVELEFIIF